ncbi:MAG: hypothetical protein PVJ36_05295 [Nitrospirota bacterium]|jgi:hypothetical protein
MKKVIIAIGIVALLAAGTTAFAHGWGSGQGAGYGGHMWGGGPGMMWGPGYSDEDSQKFLEETYDLRRQLHEKRFELREAYRLGDREKAEAAQQDLDKLYGELTEKGGFKRGPGKGYGHGPRAGYGPGYCNGPRGW